MAMPFDKNYAYSDSDKEALLQELDDIDCVMKSFGFERKMEQFSVSKYWNDSLKVLRSLSYDVGRWQEKGEKDEMLEWIGDDVIRLRKLDGIPIEAVKYAWEVLQGMRMKFGIPDVGPLNFNSFFARIINEIEEFDEKQKVEEKRRAEERRRQQQIEEEQKRQEEEHLRKEEETKAAAKKSSGGFEWKSGNAEFYKLLQTTQNAIRSQKAQSIIETYSAEHRKKAVEALNIIIEELISWCPSMKFQTTDIFVNKTVNRLLDEGYTSVELEMTRSMSARSVSAA